MPGKKSNNNKSYRENEEWTAQKKRNNQSAVALEKQTMYRALALKQRATENRLTEKNANELVRLAKQVLGNDVIGDTSA